MGKFIKNYLLTPSGQGLIVYKAAKLRDEGKTKDEVVKWIKDNKGKVIITQDVARTLLVYKIL